MKDQANQNSLGDHRSALLVSGVIVGLIILLFILLTDDISIKQMIATITMR
jgi:hypothetical protein